MLGFVTLNPTYILANFQNHIMFAQDLCHCRIEYFWNAIDLNLKDRAKRYNKSSIFNLQFSITACPGWVNDLSGRHRILPSPTTDCLIDLF
ncbi:hypothetical protein D1AOALGA4SA_8713 [Olavius algarvensis Delta 1 endosymbiont]|nr:hypothetical protein D1AOALGA4SA_8713 [Olavius algarvensis Delta 1 endosymbiont]